MHKYRITFNECEHFGDLDHYCSDLTDLGYSPKEMNVNMNEETGTVVIETTDDRSIFSSKLFTNTNLSDFLEEVIELNK